MGYDPLILHRVRALTGQKEEAIKESDLYRSEEMKQYLENLSAVFLRKEKLNVRVIADGRNGMVACTNGDSVYINYESGIAARYETPEDRWVAFMGIWFHEIAHCLYLNFDASREAREAVEAGGMYGKIPVWNTPEEKQMLEELSSAMKSPGFRPVFREIFHTLDNTFSDRHDEDCMIRHYGGLCEAGIRKARESLLSFFSLFDETENLVQSGCLSRLGAFYNTLLLYSRFDAVPMSDESLWSTSDLLKSLLSVQTEIETAGVTDDPAVRWECINRIVLAVWPYIREELQPSKELPAPGGDPQSGDNSTPRSSSGTSSSADPSGGGREGGGKQQNAAPETGREGGSRKPSEQEGSGKENGRVERADGKSDASPGSGGSPNPELTPDAAERILEKLREGAAGIRPADMPSHRKTGSRNGQEQNPAAGPEGADNRKKSREALEQAVHALRHGIAESRAQDELEQELAVGLILKLNAVKQNPEHLGVPVRVSRNLDKQNREEYEALMETLRPSSRRMQRAVQEALKEQAEAGIARHQPYGRILVAQDTYRPDGLYYARKKCPKDRPDMAVSLLVDCSGSMGGERIEAAKKAALMLYDFSSALEIPVYVAGHAARACGVIYETYADFERVTRKDRYRICGMRASGCNRDGCAIEISARLLSERPEKIRLLLVISDGQPNHNGYCGTAAASDIRSIIRRYRKQNVEIAAAGIGSDRDQIREIYGDSYLDISDLNSLPKQMVSLVRKRILENL